VHTLYPHQEEALQYAIPRSRIALYMEMRLGKSIVAVRWAKGIPKLRKILLLAPIAAIPDWCVELDNEGEYFFDLTGLDKRDRLDIVRIPPRTARTWYLINYESLRNTPEFWEDISWGAIVADESSLFRNPKAATTKIMVNKFANVRYRAVLSGTPNPESPLDYFSQMQFLNGEFCGFHNFWSFRERLFKPDRMGWKWQPRTGTRERIKNELDLLTFQRTRKQAKIGPGAVEERRMVEPTPEQARAFKDLKKKFEWKDEASGETLETQWATVREVWMQRIAGGFSPDRQNPRMISPVKTQELIRLLEGDLKGQSVVVWFRFLEEMMYVQKVIGEKYKVGMIYGDVNKVERAEVRRAFDTGKIQVLLMQIDTGRFAMNLSKADTAIYYSFTYSLEKHLQSKDRIVHMRKDYPLLYIHLMTKGSPDEDVIDALKDKNQTSAQFRNRLMESIQARFSPEIGSTKKRGIRVVRPGDTM
jgi:SNF2 family DNA or RNA helicase